MGNVAFDTLAEATVQELHLELLLRAGFNDFDSRRVRADLLAHRQDWQAVLVDTWALSAIGGEGKLIKLRDLAKNIYNVDTLYLLAVDEAAARRLAAFAEPWQANHVEIFSRKETEALLGGCDENLRLVTMWWD